MRTGPRLLLLLALVAPAGAAAEDRAGNEFFERHVRPLLVEHCYPCHSAGAGKRKAELAVDTREGLRRGGLSGPALVPGEPGASLLLRAVRYEDPDLQMPPDGPLPREAVALLEAWVAQGAPDPRAGPPPGAIPDRWWSLVPPAEPALPAVRRRDWPATSVDHFVLARLEQAGLSPAPPADRHTLLRRVTYDLTGLPPTFAEQEAFARDRRPDAFARVVDRLLASPHFGERWGRHWLDVARYADTKGPLGRLPFAYTYRDWVIRAFNEDLPYDRFVVAQLAGDLLPGPARRRALPALGFLTLGRHNLLDTEHDRIDDRIDVVTRGLLGLTVNCARCHNHKFDPISIKDYYALYGVFASSREPADLPLLEPEAPLDARERAFVAELRARQEAITAFETARHEEHKASFRRAGEIARYLCAAREGLRLDGAGLDALSKERDLNRLMLARWRAFLVAAGPGDPVFGPWHALAGLPGAGFAASAPAALARALRAPGVNARVAAAFAGPPPRRPAELCERYGTLLAGADGPSARPEPADEALRRVLRGEGAPPEVPFADAFELQSEGDKNAVRALRRRIDALLADHAFAGGAPRAMALEDGPPRDAPVFLRGNPLTPAEIVPRRFLAALAGPAAEPFRRGSGRLELAEAIVRPDNPLTARVMVNRAWHQLHGAGLVRTPSDFGTRGDPPTHPELLDHLARRFVADGWSIKRLVRLLVLSRVYQQASVATAAARARDPENLLFTRMNRRRLDAEALRDTLLAASGQLDRTVGGVPVSLTAHPPSRRRTVYGFVDRARLPQVLRAFDFASPDQHSPGRQLTTVPPQALYLMNSPFVLAQADALARRPEVARARDPAARIRALHRAAFGRDPAPAELTAGLRFIAAETDDAPPAPPPGPWRYGTGAWDPARRRLERFVPLPAFADDGWQAAPLLPHPTVGRARLTAEGGEPGLGPGHAVVRRLVVPCDGRASVGGTVKHREPKHGDGIEARVVSSREGELAAWVLRDREARTELSGVVVRAGDTLDFVVDGRADPEGDAFTWAPEVRIGRGDEKNPAACREEQVLRAAAGFQGPAPPRLDRWGRYAQVLLLSHDIAFLD